MLIVFMKLLFKYYENSVVIFFNVLTYLNEQTINDGFKVFLLLFI